MNDPSTIRLEHSYSHSSAQVWRALTEPEILARWWAPGDIRPVVGHRFEMDMGPWGKQPCVVLAVEPEKLLRFRFADGTMNTVISWELRAEGTGALLTLTHEGFDTSSPMGQRAFQGMGQGWPAILDRLASAIS